MIRLTSMFTLVLACSARAVYAFDDAADLLKFVPDDANALGLIRVAEILQSPRARAEGWAGEQEEQFLAGAALIPPWVRAVAIGAHVHPGPESHGWTVALMKLPRQVQMTLVAEHERSRVEQLAGFDIVASSRGAYFVGLPPDVLGIRSPALRQETSRWIRGVTTERQPQLSPYLVEAASVNEHIVMALDLRDMADPQRLRERLEASPALSNASIDALHRLLAGLRGVRLTATLTEQIQARIRFDFFEPPGAQAEYIKPLFLEFLNDQGALLPDLVDSKVSTAERSVTLSTTLSDGGFRRILSLLVTPKLQVQPPQAPEPREDVEEPIPSPGRAERVPSARRSAEIDPAASKRYLARIDSILADLRRSLRRAKEYERTAKWHETFAEKIDDLPIAGVDPELLEFGSFVSSKLRALAASLRGQGVEVNTQQRSVTWNMNVDPGAVAASWWGGAGYRAPTWQATSNLQEVRQRQAEAISNGSEQRLAIWQMIDDEAAEVRKRMAQKYGPPFE
jgi:hypothetical protein